MAVKVIIKSDSAKLLGEAQAAISDSYLEHELAQEHDDEDSVIDSGNVWLRLPEPIHGAIAHISFCPTEQICDLEQSSCVLSGEDEETVTHVTNMITKFLAEIVVRPTTLDNLVKLESKIEVAGKKFNIFALCRKTPDNNLPNPDELSDLIEDELDKHSVMPDNIYAVEYWSKSANRFKWDINSIGLLGKYHTISYVLLSEDVLSYHIPQVKLRSLAAKFPNVVFLPSSFVADNAAISGNYVTISYEEDHFKLTIKMETEKSYRIPPTSLFAAIVIEAILSANYPADITELMNNYGVEQ